MGLILVANPGSSSRKYALYDHDSLKLRATLHFEIEDNRVVCAYDTDETESRRIDISINDVNHAAEQVSSIFAREGAIHDNETIDAIGLRIVAPSAYFMQDRVFDDEVLAKLEQVKHLAPLHVAATLSELHILKAQFADARIVGVSDSAFHIRKPTYAWNYGINIHDADRLDIKRFGYHGISVASAIDELWNRGKLPPKVIVCHLGSGSSITGVFHGRSIDNSMGFTPNEGVIMATRSGTLPVDVANALKRGLELDDAALEDYLNHHAGLMGLSECNDIRELITQEQNGEHLSHLALDTLIHSIHKQIGAMLVALNGCDLLVFAGTVGERSAILRKRIIAHLEFADFILDGDLNAACTAPESFTSISQAAKSKPIIVIPTDEAKEIARHTKKLL